MRKPPQKSGEVAIIRAPRLPYHPAVEEKFGIDKSQWKALCEAVFPSAKTPDAIILALSYCKARRLDPFKRNVHIVPIYDSKQKREVETVWPGIAEHRTTATRTGTFAGMDAPEFGPMVTKTFTGRSRSGYGQDAEWKDDAPAEVTFPEWCRVTVYRMVQGQRVPFPGPKVFWLEYYNRKGRYSEIPNEQWLRRPSYMIEKCGEAGALRRAFPEELGEEFTVEEAGFFQGGGGQGAQQVDAEVLSTTEPTRGDFMEGKAESEDATEHNAETGEVGDSAPAADPEPNRWYPEVVGQEAVTKALVDLIKGDLVKTLDDLDAIEEANRARVAKFTQANRAAISNALDDRRDDLQQGGR